MYLMQGMKEMRKEITDNVKVYFVLLHILTSINGKSEENVMKIIISSASNSNNPLNEIRKMIVKY